MSNNGLENENKKERDHVHLPIEEQDNQVEGLRGVNYIENVEDSRANANANTGGDAVIGGLAAIDPMVDEANASEETAETGLAAINATASGNASGSNGLADVEVPDLKGGEEVDLNNTTENEDDEETIEEDTEGAEQELVLPAEFRAMSEQLRTDMTEAKNSLNSATENSRENADGGGNNDGSGTNTGGGNNNTPTAPNGLAALGNQGGGDLTEATREGTTERTNSETNLPQDDTSRGILNSVGIVNENELTDEQRQQREADQQLRQQQEQELSQAFAEGRNVGMGAGCTIALQKKAIKTESGYEYQEDFDSYEEASNYVKEVRDNYKAQIAVGEDADDHQKAVAKKKEDGYNAGYNAGYAYGRRAKLDLQRAQRNANPDYQQGKTDGNTAGNAQGVGDSVRAKALRDAAQSKSEEYKRGFFSAYNTAYMAARMEKAKSIKTSSTVVNDPSGNYSKGFDWGERMGIAYAKGEITREQLSAANQLANQNKNESGQQMPNDGVTELNPTPLFKRGYFAGYNKGYSSGRQIVANERTRAPQEGDANYGHYMAGQIFGALAGVVGKEDAYTAVKDRSFSMARLGENLPPIPDSVYDYFEQGTDTQIRENQEVAEGEQKPPLSEEAQAFDRGYIKGYNTAYQASRLQQAQQLRQELNNDDYKIGRAIGVIAGKANVVLHEVTQRIEQIQNDPNKTEELSTLQKKQESFTKNLKKIKETIDASVNKDQQRGYFDGYTAGNQQERLDKVRSKASRRLTEARNGTGEYGSGYVTGKMFGKKIFDLFRSTPPPTAEQRLEIRKKIQEAMKMAREKNTEYYEGFMNGYNIGYQGEADELDLDEGSQSAKNDYRDKIRELEGRGTEGKFMKKYYEKGAKFAFKLFYEFLKGEGPNPAQKIREAKEKLPKQIENGRKAEEDKIPSNVSDQKLMSAYEEGAAIGERWGKSAGTRFKIGFDTAVSGGDKNENDLYYVAGYKAGQKESEYREMRNSLFEQMGIPITDLSVGVMNAQEEAIRDLTDDEDMQVKLLAAFRKGYQMHYKPWLKIYVLHKGGAVPKSLSDTSIDEISRKIEKGDKSEYDYAAILVNKKEDIQKEQLKDYLSDQEGKSDEELGAPVEQLASQFKQGYLKALEKSEEEVDRKLDDDVLYQKGLEYGMVSENAHLKLAEDDPLRQRLIERKRTDESAADREKSKYNQGRARGVQIGIFINNGSNIEDFRTELQGVKYKAGFKNGYKKGKSEAESASEAIKSGELLPERETHEDAKNGLSGDELRGFNDGLEKGYTQRIDYLRGFHKGYRQTTNASELDDYDNTLLDGLNDNASFIKGLREGRKRGFIDVSLGKVALLNNQTSAATMQMQERINSILTNFNNEQDRVYGYGYEKGYREGFALVKDSQEDKLEPQYQTTFQNETLKHAPSLAIEKAKSMVGHAMHGLNTQTTDPLYEKYNEILTHFSAVEHGIDTEKPLNEIMSFLQTETDKIFRTILQEAPLDTKEQFESLQQQFNHFFADYKRGFESGGNKGIRAGMEIKQLTNQDEDRASGESIDHLNTADQFMTQLLAAVVNKEEQAYTDGHAKAITIGKRIALTETNSSLPQLRLQRHIMVDELYATLNNKIGVDYATYKKQTESVEADHELEIKIMYRHLISQLEFNYEVPADLRTEAEIKSYLDEQIQNLKNTYLNALDEQDIHSEVKKYFEDKINTDWSNYIRLYRQGFNVGFEIGLKKGIEQRESGGTQEDDTIVRELHEALMAGQIEDATINEIDWEDTIDIIREQRDYYRSSIGNENSLLYDSQYVLFDLQDELSFALNELNNLQEVAPEEPGYEDYLKEKGHLKFIVDDKSEDISYQEEYIAETEEVINEEVEEYRQFIRTNLHFQSADNEVNRLKNYLSSPSGDLMLSGHYNDPTGQMQISGPGSFSIEDTRDRVTMLGDIFLQLGGLQLTSFGYELDKQNNLATLKPGHIFVPEEGGREEINIHFSNSLVFEFGLNIIEQIEHQLGLDDELTGGSIFDDMDLFNIV